MFSCALTEDLKFNIAVVTGTLSFFYGLVLVLAPQKKIDGYMTEKIQFKDPEVSWLVLHALIQQEALCIVTATGTWGLHVVEGLSREQAIGVGVLPWIVFTLYILLNDYPKRTRSSSRSQYSNLMVFGAVVYATLGNTTYSNIAAKTLVGFALAHGLLLFLAPAMLSPLYNLAERESGVLFGRQSLGNNMISMSALLGALAWDATPLQAAGFSWASLALGLLLMRPACIENKVCMSKVTAWTVLALVLSAVYLADLSKPEDDPTESAATVSQETA